MRDPAPIVGRTRRSVGLRDLDQHREDPRKRGIAAGATHSLTIIMSSFVIASIALMPLGDGFALRAMAVAAILGWLASSVLTSIYSRKVAIETVGDPPADRWNGPIFRAV